MNLGWTAGAAAAVVLVAAAWWYVGPRTGAGVPPDGQATAPATVAGRNTGRAAAAAALPAVGRRAPGPGPDPGAAPPAAAAQGGESGAMPLATMPFPDEPLARVNGVPVTPAEVFPPGVMREGDKLAKSTYDKFLDEAVNRAVIVQEAERRGYADAPEFTRLADQLRADIAGLPDLTPEQRQWQLNELKELALAEQLYRAEGILPTRVPPADVEAVYRQRSSDYDWVRTREAQRGSTPEKIERRVREEIRRDLQAPIARETRRRREELTAKLRQSANVEIP